MTLQEKTQAWKQLKELVGKVVDPTLRTMIMGEFRNRAIADWGIDPENTPRPTQKVELDDWEKALLEDIKDFKEYGVDLHSRSDSETREAHNRMLDFIDHGGTLFDIPADICTENIKKLYFQCLDEWINNLIKN
jgi:hypothetical protein